MYRTFISLLALSAMLAAVLLAAVVIALADGPLAAPPPTVLLLRNGRTLEGKIARDGDFYLIARPQGEVRLRADQAEAAFADFAECYAYKRSRLFADSPDDRLELAGWCITHGLLTEAEGELADIARLWPRHPRASLVQRRLELARQPVKIAEPAREPADAPSDDELSKAMKSLPRGTLEAFTTTVQPILQYHCATAGCHGPSTTSAFQMERLAPGQPVTDRQTQRNLLAVLGEINAGTPEKSPLLAQAQQPHGEAKGPLFAAHELNRLRQLAAFVKHAAAAGRAGAATSDAEKEKTAAQPASFVKDEAQNDADEIDPPALDHQDTPAAIPNIAPPTIPAGGPRGQSSLPPPSRPAPGPQPSDLGFTPRDAYDAEIFNRRYGTK